MKIKVKKYIYPLIILSLVIIIAIFNFNNYEGFTNTTEYDIVIIAGQSNAVGNGIEDFIPNWNSPNWQVGRIDEPRFYDAYFQNDKNNMDPPSNTDTIRKNRIKSFSSSNEILVAQDPIGQFPETSTGRKQGFGIPFARQYVKEKNRNVMLLGCAMGSTAFTYFGPANGGANTNGKNYGWSEGDPNNTNKCNGNDCSLFKMAKERIDRLSEKISSRSKIVAILWQQGEQDHSIIGNNNSTKFYKDGVALMLKHLRNYARSKFPNEGSVPILMGGACTYETTTRDINPIIQQIVLENTNSIFKYVPSDDSLGAMVPKFIQSLMPNNRRDFGGRVHFSRMSQIELGYRYFYIFNDNHINFN